MYNIKYNCSVPVLKKDQYILYNIYLGSKKLNYIKYGTTNNPERRFKDLARHYETDITVNFISPPMTKYSALRLEDNIRADRIKKGWSHIPNDRFIKPARVKKDVIKIRKEYEFSF